MSDFCKVVCGIEAFLRVTKESDNSKEDTRKNKWTDAKAEDGQTDDDSLTTATGKSRCLLSHNFENSYFKFSTATNHKRTKLKRRGTTNHDQTKLKRSRRINYKSFFLPPLLPLFLRIFPNDTLSLLFSKDTLTVLRSVHSLVC